MSDPLKAPRKKTCFVIMPFKEPFNGYYRKIFVPAIRKVGLEPVRADAIKKPGVIVSQIWNSIQDAEICIADVTGNNSNVMFEIGLAHAIGKPVIQIAQKPKDLPFDIKSLRHIIYRIEQPKWAEQLRHDLEKMLQEALANPLKARFFDNVLTRGKMSFSESISGRSAPDLFIKNIFAIPDENTQRDFRMKELLSENSGDLCLLARTGFNYLHEMGANYKAGVAEHLAKGKKFNVILENPYSQMTEVELRASSGAGRWDKISPQRIYQLLVKFGSNLEIRFTENPVFCSLFFVSGSVIYDPYHLGRRNPANRSGNQFLVFELQKPPIEKQGGCRDYYGLLTNYFTFLWNDTEKTKTFADLCKEHSVLNDLIGNSH